MEDEGWGTCYLIIVAFNVAPLWAHKEFKQSGSVCTTVWGVICRNELCLRGLDRSKKQNLNSSLIDLISFLFLIFFSFQAVSLCNMLPEISCSISYENNAILTCFLLSI